NTRPWSASMHDLQRMQAPSKYPAVLGLDPLIRDDNRMTARFCHIDVDAVHQPFEGKFFIPLGYSRIKQLNVRKHRNSSQKPIVNPSSIWSTNRTRKIPSAAKPICCVEFEPHGNTVCFPKDAAHCDKAV